MTANFIAGVTLGSKIVHAGMALAYLLAELVASKVQVPDAKAEATVTVEAAEKPATELVVTDVNADEALAPNLPVAPVSPAPRVYSERHERRLRTGR